MTSFDVVIPTVGRPSLLALLAALRRSVGPQTQLIVVDDRKDAALPLLGGLSGPRVRVIRSGGQGPAAARNKGWRATNQDWIAFLDDHVDLPLNWVQCLEHDLREAPTAAAAITGNIRVPFPSQRPRTDWERNVARLEGTTSATADMAIRRRALEDVGGFDRRFPNAYREDTDLVLRLQNHDWQIVRGTRQVWHRPRPAPWWISVRLQRGNADDVRLEHTHGPGWRTRIGESPGNFSAHRLTTVAAVVTAMATLTKQRVIACSAGALWLGRTCRFAWVRIAPGPRTPREVLAMAATSVAIPPAACIHRLRGWLQCIREK